MSRIPPASARLHYVGTGRHLERLTLAPGRNAYDGQPFDPAAADPAELAAGTFVPHLGDPATGSMLAHDGRHVAVPALVGRLLSAASTAGRGGGLLAGGGAVVSVGVALAGSTPALSAGAVGLGLAAKAVAWSVERLGAGSIAAVLRRTREEVASLEEEIGAVRASNDNAVRDIARAIGALTRPDLTPSERIREARSRLDLPPPRGLSPS